VIVVVGNQIVATGPIGAPSPQIGARFHSRAAATSGFVFRFATTLPGAVSVYVITAGNAVHPVAAAGFPLGRPLRRIQFPGAMVAVRPAPIGAITVMTSKKLYVSEFNVPPGGNVTGFDLATFISGRTIGDAELTLSQDDGADLGLLNGTAIVANTLPLAGSQIAVRVGSCLSWHGYTAGPLYLAQEGGTPITKLELSGVKT
jgi:hypothetical protein